MAEVAVQEQKARAERSDRRNRMALRLICMPVEEIQKQAAPTDVEPGKSKAVTEDPFVGLAANGRIIEPPFHMLSLAMLPEQNTELTPVIESMETNIEGFGHILQSRVDPSEASVELKRAIKVERVRLTNFFNYANLRDSFVCLRRKLRKDLEATGNAYWEIIRNAAGKIQGITHLPSYQMRLGRIDERPIKVEVPTLQLQEDGSFRIEPITAWEQFRPFVQSRMMPTLGLHTTAGDYKLRYFKEFGDPRVWNNETGEVVKPEGVANWKGSKRPMPEDLRANEVVHFKLYSTRSPYGLPRYIGNLLSVFGDRAAEEINYTTFRNNNIPSMAVLCSNGQLTEGTLQRIESFVESAIQGSDNYSKFLIIEAESDLEGEDSGQIKIQLVPLTDNQIKDALFQNYRKANQDNVRRAWRLPPIFVGKSDDYTRATADASRRLADEQVFAPERDEFDAFINRRLFPAMDVVYHRYKSNSPNTTDNAELVRILGGAEKTGGMTPEIARIVLEDILGRELPDFVEDPRFNPKLPFSLLMAEAVKNKADVAEPGQQVTALKRLLEDDAFDDDTTLEEVLLPHLVRMRKRLERQFEARVSEGGL